MGDDVAVELESTSNVGGDGMDLSWLISPFDRETFLSKYWAKAPLRISRGRDTYYRYLLSEEELEFVLYTASRSRSLELLCEDDVPELCHSHEVAIAGFRQGKSMRVDGIQDHSFAITTLVRKLEKVISCPVNVNMYLTPGSGKKALRRHYDTHDVFVLQIHGDKTWRLYDCPVNSPLEYLPLQRHESMREMEKIRLGNDLSARDMCVLTDEFTLHPGDCLYLPRGFWHEAESKPGEVSCHLTVGMQPVTYLDLVSVGISQLALSNLQLRENLPFGFAADPGAAKKVAAQVDQVLRELPKMFDTQIALSQVTAHALRKHKTDFNNHLVTRPRNKLLDHLNEDSQIQLLDDAVCVMDAESSPPRLILGNGIFEITPPYVEACHYILKTPRFAVSDLPGRLTLPQKVALVQQLITEGLLSIDKAPPISTDYATIQRGWLPIQIDLAAHTIKWLDFGARRLAEPFFQESIRQLIKENPTARIFSTGLQALDDLSEEISPSGFIFHVSRCGSTLLSNGLRAIRGSVVISEAQAIGDAVASLSEADPYANGNGSLLTENQGRLLRGIVRAYGQRRMSSEKTLVIKFSSWNLLHIAAIRRIWPQVPCVIITRDPVEVAVSCLENRPGWMRWKSQPRVVETIFGWDAEDTASMRDTTFCARVIGEFLKSASCAIHEGCQVIDYRSLDSSAIVSVARRFGMEVRNEDIENIEKSLSVYSKDFKGKRVFVEDRKSKQEKATKDLRKEIQTWAQQAYEDIMHECCDR